MLNTMLYAMPQPQPQPQPYVMQPYAQPQPQQQPYANVMAQPQQYCVQQQNPPLQQPNSADDHFGALSVDMPILCCGGPMLLASIGLYMRCMGQEATKAKMQSEWKAKWDAI